MRPSPPEEILRLADERAAARRARDWTLADELRARIEAAGWRVIDAGTLYDLLPAAAPDVESPEGTRYGSSRSVPSRLDEAPTAPATVVVHATAYPKDLDRCLHALAAGAPAGTQVVVVANAPDPEQAAALPATLESAAAGGLVVERVATSSRLGFAAACNAGIRRAAGAVVVLLDTSVETGGGLVGRLVAALADDGVAVAGPFGIVSANLRRFEDAPDGAVEVDAIEGYALAFRRSDYLARGPLDEHFDFYRNLDIWWSLVLRDGEDPAAPDDARPRRAVRVAADGVLRHEHRGWRELPDAERDRRSRRNFYRILKRFGARRDLLVANDGRPRPA